MQSDFHSARLTECGAHSKVSDDDSADSDDIDDIDDPDNTMKYCPHAECSGLKKFAKGQSLRRHYATR